MRSSTATVIAVVCQGGSGCHVAAANFAYFAKPFSKADRCMVVSNDAGVANLKKLFGVKDQPDQLQVYDRTVHVASLESLDSETEVLEYVQVICGDVPIQAEMVSSAKRLYLGLCHQPIHPIFGINLGYGEGRKGVTVYQGPTLPLASVAASFGYQQFKDALQKPFGLVYFTANTLREEDQAETESKDKQRAKINPSIAPDFIKDYLKIAEHFKVKAASYIIVGDIEYALKGIKGYTQSSTIKIKTINLFDLDQGQQFHYENGNETGSVDIFLTASFPHSSLRTLMQGAMTFVGMTGVQSMIEATGFGKISLFQYLKHNQEFSQSYYKEMKDCKGMEQLCWKQRMESECIQQVITNLNDDVWRSKASAENARLVAEGRKKAELAIQHFFSPYDAEKEQMGQQNKEKMAKTF